MKQVFSTLTSDQNYELYYVKPKTDKPVAEPATVAKASNGKPASVLIKGGHGVANEHFQTAEGVCTNVEDDVYAVLATIPMFIRHSKAGFIKVYAKKEAPATAEQAAKDMESKDGSAPLVDSDFVAGQAPTLTQAAS